jgi:hypothetical protein
MSINIIFDPIHLLIFKGFSDTFSYFPKINFLINKNNYNNNHLINEWIKLFFPNFFYSIEYFEEGKIENIKNLEFNIYDYYNKINSKNIKINLKKIKDLLNPNILNNKNYLSIILHNNLNENELSFMINYSKKIKTEKIIFIGYHKDEYLKWIQKYEDLNYIYNSNFQNNNFYNIELWKDYINTIKFSSFIISIDINWFSLIQYLVCEKVILYNINEDSSIDFSSYNMIKDDKNNILNNSINFMYLLKDYNTEQKEFYKNNLPFYFKYYFPEKVNIHLNNKIEYNKNKNYEDNINNQTILTDDVSITHLSESSVELHKKDENLKLIKNNTFISKISDKRLKYLENVFLYNDNNIINNKNKDNSINIDDNYNYNANDNYNDNENDIFPIKEKNIIIKISENIENDILIWTYIFVYYKKYDFQKHNFYLLFNMDYYNLKKNIQNFITSWLDKIKNYLNINIYNQRINLNNTIKIEKEQILNNIELKKNDIIIEDFLNYLYFPKNRQIVDLNYNILDENITHIYNKYNKINNKYIVLKHSIKNDVLDYWKKNNHVIDFGFIEEFRDYIPESDFDILYRDIHFIINCKNFIGFENLKNNNYLNNLNSFLIYLLTK